MTDPLISVIMPAYNAESYVSEAIRSVIAQSYQNWELLVVDDGSEDKTGEIVRSFTDPRIRRFTQQNKGVSAARNLALYQMQGEYFCFLDSDDVLPPTSIEARYAVFMQDPAVRFVDGYAHIKNSDMTEILNDYTPDFRGNPLYELLKLNGNCFYGNTWMIKRMPGQSYHFDENASHAEELLFYLSISREGRFSFTTDFVLFSRIRPASAMTNYRGLEEGYERLVRYVKNNIPLTGRQFRQLKFKVTSIMFKSYLKKGNVPAAIRIIFRYLFL